MSDVAGEKASEVVEADAPGKTAEGSIYGDNRPQLEELQREVVGSIDELRRQIVEQTGLDPVEHCLSRVKSEESMREKCRRQGLPETPRSALVDIHDALGIRVVCAFRSDVYLVRDHLVNLPGFTAYIEKDYIRAAKPNGYRSYHLILRTTDGRAPVGCEEACDGGAGHHAVVNDDAKAAAEAAATAAAGKPANVSDGAEEGGFFVEVQLRTISMDTWAALEHHLKYKKEAPANEKLIVNELKRCADELASTDLSMQALRDLILGEL